MARNKLQLNPEWKKSSALTWSLKRKDFEAELSRSLNPKSKLIEWRVDTIDSHSYFGQDFHRAVSSV